MDGGASSWVSADAHTKLEVPELVGVALFRVLLASAEALFVNVPEVSGSTFLWFLLAAAADSVEVLAVGAHVVSWAAVALAGVEVPDVFDNFAATSRWRACAFASAGVPVETSIAVFSLQAKAFAGSDAPVESSATKCTGRFKAVALA